MTRGGLFGLGHVLGVLATVRRRELVEGCLRRRVRLEGGLQFGRHLEGGRSRGVVADQLDLDLVADVLADRRPGGLRDPEQDDLPDVRERVRHHLADDREPVDRAGDRGPAAGAERVACRVRHGNVAAAAGRRLDRRPETGASLIRRHHGARRPPLEVREELCARLVARAEQPEDGARGHDRAGLADAAHHRAQVGRLHDHADALGIEPGLEEVRDLLGQPLLDLEPACIGLDDARDLGQPDHAPARDVRHGRGAEERQEMVLAQRVERDVLDDHHLAVVDVEDRPVDESLRVDVVAGGQLGVHAVHPLRRADQPVARRVFADLDQDLADGRFDAVGASAVAMVAAKLALDQRT